MKQICPKCHNNAMIKLVSWVDGMYQLRDGFECVLCHTRWRQLACACKE